MVIRPVGLLLHRHVQRALLFPAHEFDNDDDAEDDRGDNAVLSAVEEVFQRLKRERDDRKAEHGVHPCADKQSDRTPSTAFSRALMASSLKKDMEKAAAASAMAAFSHESCLTENRSFFVRITKTDNHGWTIKDSSAPWIKPLELKPFLKVVLVFIHFDYT